MENCELPDNFEGQGFIIIKQVLSAEEVKELRKFIKDKFESYGNKRFLYPDEMMNYPEFFQLYFRGRIVETLKKVLGDDLCYYNDFSVQHNVFGGWHKDCDGEVPAKYLMDSDYKFAKCGIYLQDNTKEWGGGINVLPGGHKFPVKSGFYKIDHFVKKIFNRVMTNFKGAAMDIKAGDMVIFDSRLPHSAVFPYDMAGLTMGRLGEIHGIPEEHTKFVIYWNASNIKIEKEFLLHRETYQAQKKEGIDFHISRILKSYFPDDFPDEFVNLSKENSVKLSTLSKEKCRKFKRKLEQVAENNSGHLN